MNTANLVKAVCHLTHPHLFSFPACSAHTFFFFLQFLYPSSLLMHVAAVASAITSPHFSSVVRTRPTSAVQILSLRIFHPSRLCCLCCLFFDHVMVMYQMLPSSFPPAPTHLL